MMQKAIEDYGEEYILKDLSFDRFTEPKDIAPIVTLLASGLADHATGTTIDINAASYLH
jgi:3-oxoacyl-[acyl-carrier protein] reductase